jgi:hypothetical protein
MKRLLTVLLAALLYPATASAQDKEFKRVDQFPKGDQIAVMSSTFFAGAATAHAEQNVYSAPFEKVWAAAQRAALALDKMGGRSVVATDERSGKIQNGQISQDSLVGRGSFQWMDEFVTEVTRLTASMTRVTVSRKVVKKTQNLRHEYVWQTMFSNGKIERWVLTQIDDEVANGGVDYAKSAPGRYSHEKKPDDLLELRPDGTFSLRQKKKDYTGQYEVAGSVMTLVIGKSATQAKMLGNTIIDPEDGSRWIKEGGGDAPAAAATASEPTAPQAGAQTASQPGDESAEVLTNADVTRMVEAKLPEGVILSKIRGSACKFDTSTDALIKLKQAGATDAVLQALAESKCKP